MRETEGSSDGETQRQWETDTDSERHEESQEGHRETKTQIGEAERLGPETPLSWLRCRS